MTKTLFPHLDPDYWLARLAAAIKARIERLRDQPGPSE